VFSVQFEVVFTLPLEQTNFEVNTSAFTAEFNSRIVTLLSVYKAWSGLNYILPNTLDYHSIYKASIASLDYNR